MVEYIAVNQTVNLCQMYVNKNEGNIETQERLQLQSICDCVHFILTFIPPTIFFISVHQWQNITIIF